MEPISRLNRVIGLIRSREAGRLGQGRRTGVASSTDKGGAPAPLEHDVRHAVIDRLRGLDLDTPQGARQGVRVFLEAIFRSEMGQDALASPRFSDIVSEVQSTLADDPQTQGELIDMLRALQPPSSCT